MSSDSELSDAVPDDKQIEQTLRDVVHSLPEGFSVNVARTAAEEKLGLELGFLKSDQWKARSKKIITDAAEEGPSPQEQAPAPAKVSKTNKSTLNKGNKRSSTEATTAARKRQKQSVSDSGSELSSISSAEDDEALQSSGEDLPKPVKKKLNGANSRPRKGASAQKATGKKSLEVKAASDSEKTQPEKSVVEKKAANEDSESELSDVLDEPPPKRKRQKSKSAETTAKAKPGKGTKASTAAAKDLSPDEAEIKRLQGWLVKCGIRKVWGRYLAPYDTPKAKIKHLKDMLKDVGMDGRYSNEKASAIKEQRELAADLEAVQEGAKKWGHDEAEDEDTGNDTKPKRRAAAAARFVDFGDSGEESD